MNRFYNTLPDENKAQYKILFENSVSSSKKFNGLIEKESESTCKIELTEKAMPIQNSNQFNDSLKNFIELQKDNSIIDLSYICFYENVNFIEADNEIFKILKNAGLIESEVIKLNNENKQQTKFIKSINLRSATFFKEAIFRKCIFNHEVILEGAEFKDIANFRNAKFKKKFSFNSSRFRDIVYFEEAKFYKDANFESAHFYRFAYFENATFKKFVSFKDTYVEAMINFHNVRFEKIDLENSNFKNVNFLGIRGFQNPVLNIKNFANRDSARIIKAHFENENNITEANKYFVIEQELCLDDLHDKDSSEPNRRLNMISFFFSKYVSNYGTDWVRVLIVLFGFGFLASWFYSLLIGNQENYKYIVFSKREEIYLLGGFIFSIFLYFLYNSKKNVSKLILFIVCMYYFQAFVMYPDLQSLHNNIITLINPLNIFNQDMYLDISKASKDRLYFININYFETVALYGVIVKGIAITLIYQFIISFRNSTRRK